jgi:hypothetical protein
MAAPRHDDMNLTDAPAQAMARRNDVVRRRPAIEASAAVKSHGRVRRG